MKVQKIAFHAIPKIFYSIPFRDLPNSIPKFPFHSIFHSMPWQQIAKKPIKIELKELLTLVFCKPHSPKNLKCFFAKFELSLSCSFQAISAFSFFFVGRVKKMFPLCPYCERKPNLGKFVSSFATIPVDIAFFLTADPIKSLWDVR